MVSNFPACSAGMMPFQSEVTNSHSTFISSQSALAMSMSKPVSWPSEPSTLNGGYAPSVPMRILLQSFASAAPNAATDRIAAAAIVLIPM